MSAPVSVSMNTRTERRKLLRKMQEWELRTLLYKLGNTNPDGAADEIRRALDRIERRRQYKRAHHDKRQPKLFRMDVGFCRFCGQEIIDQKTGKRSRRRTWHDQEKHPKEPPCLQTYLLSFSQYLRQKVWERDHGVCAKCGKYDDNWEADHIKPRADGGSLLLSNVQTLCSDCHDEKTARENSARRKRRKG